MMLLAVISLAGPGAFERVFSAAEHLTQVHAINVRLALMLMVVYALYLYFMLGTHRDEFAGESEGGHGHGRDRPGACRGRWARWSGRRCWPHG